MLPPRGPRNPAKVSLLVVYKKSQLELYHEHQPGAIESLERREASLVEPYHIAHNENLVAIEKVKSVIRGHGIEARFSYRAHHESTDGYDLVISVGGDGTLLDVSHNVFHAPILGVNSSTYSVGHFCATNCDGFGDLFERWMRREMEATPLQRLRVAVNGNRARTPVLNEVLLSHVIPAGMSRYLIEIDGISEQHKSSGIWISTAAGSSAAIRSAGGQLMDPTDVRMQYVVREPYRWGGLNFELGGGIIEGPIRLLSKMRTGGLYLDGHREQLTLAIGDRIFIDPHPNPLCVVGYRRPQPPVHEPSHA
jgi:NAD+ kinase